MTVTEHTALRNIPYPTGADFVNEGPLEMQQIAEAVDTENSGDVDFLQPGVVASTDWNFTAEIENATTYTLKSSASTGGTAWIAQSTLGLIRTVTPPGSANVHALSPGKISSGKYVAVGIELTPGKWNGPATVSCVTGIEQTTQSLAESHVPAVSAGKLRVRDVFIANGAGTYATVGQIDRRVYATRPPNEGTYSALSAWSTGTLYASSQTRPAQVTVWMTIAPSSEVSISIGGVAGPKIKTAGTDGFVPVTFRVEPAQLWEATIVSGSVASAGYQYVTI